MKYLVRSVLRESRLMSLLHDLGKGFSRRFFLFGSAGPVIFILTVIGFPFCLHAGYTDQSAARLPGDSLVSYGFAARDLDGDGTPELLVITDGQNLLLENDGTGNYQIPTSASIPAASATTLDAAFADIDSDGDYDILLANSGVANSVWVNDGTGSFLDETSSRLPASIGNTMALETADIDRDGDIDVVTGNLDGLNRVLINDGTGVFVDQTMERGILGPDPTFGLQLADMSGDGVADIFVANRGSQNRLWINNGLGYFTEMTAQRLPLAAGRTNGALAVDIDGDGDRDLLVAEGVEGLKLLLNGDGATFTDTPGRMPDYAGYSVGASVADVEPDGDPDILATYGDGTRLLLNDGQGQFTDGTATALPADIRRTFGLLAIDTDNDLDQDLLLATPGGENRLLVNDTTVPRVLADVLPAYREIGTQVSVQVSVYDEEPVSWSVAVIEPGGNLVDLTPVGDNAPFVPVQAGLHAARVVAEDASGNSVVRVREFEVAAGDTIPPVVSVALDNDLPVRGQRLKIQVSAEDSGSGVARIRLWVDGIEILVDSSGGADYLTTTLGIQNIEALVEDVAGNSTAAGPTQFEVVADLDPPVLQGVTVTPGLAELNTPVAIGLTATDNVGITDLQALITGPGTPPAGEVIALTLGGDPEARTATGSYRPLLPGSYRVDLLAIDPSGNEVTGLALFDAVGTPDAESPVVSLTVLPHSVAIGGSINLSVSASDDVGVTGIELHINGLSVPLDVDGNAVYTPLETGVYNLVASAYDDWGNIGTAVDSLQAVNPSDDLVPPMVEIIAPSLNSEITGKVAIQGTVTDDTLVSYRLEVAPQGGGFTEFSNGSLEVLGGVLGTLDTEGFTEGFYEIRLVAQDINGATASTATSYLYTGNGKLGRFTLEYEDVRIPAKGFPITVRRGYDSGRPEVGDFGPGWRLSLLDSDLREDDRGNVFVTLPDGRRTGFSFRPRQLSPFFPFFQVEYSAPPGVYDQLDTPDCDVIVMSGGQWFCDIGGGLFNPENYRISTRDGMIYDISQSAGVQRIEDRKGNFMAIASDGITSSSGRNFIFSRDTAGRIISIDDPAGGSFDYEYDSEGRLAVAIDQEGNRTDYTYQGSSHLLDDLMTPGGCFPIKQFYDAEGRVIERQDSAGNSTVYVYDDEARTETLTNGSGAVTRYHYDEAGRIVRIDDALGTSTLNELDAQGNKIAVTEPSGRVIRYTYDENGNQLTRTVEPEPGNVLTYESTYNTYSQVTRYREPEGNGTGYVYDTDGNLLRREFFDASGSVVALETYTYDDSGNRLSWTDEEGMETRYEYNSFGDLIGETDPSGVIQNYEYDANGNRIAYIDGLGNRSGFSFSGLNKITSMTHAGESDPRYRATYNEQGSIETLIDANGAATTWEYNCMGGISGVVDATGSFTRYDYNASNNLSHITDANGGVTDYGYDAANRLTDRTGADDQTWGFGYSPDGTLNQLSKPDGTETFHRLDDVNRMIQRIESERTLQFDYDGNSRLTGVLKGTGSSVVPVAGFNYDSQGRLLTSTDSFGRSIVYTRNGRGDPVTLTIPGGLITRYDYDAAGRVSMVTTGLHHVSYQYDAAGRLSLISYSNGTTATYGYDTLGYLIAVKIRDSSNALIGFYNYTLDGNGQRTAVTMTDGTIDYTLDPLNRLLNETVDSLSLGTFSESYAYDAVGNRLDAGASFGEDNRLLSHGGVATIHDANGNLTNRDSEVFTYDSNNRLVGYTDGTTTAGYSYDYLGRRITRRVGSATIEYLYDGQNTVAEYDSGGALLAHYSYGPGMDQLLMVQRSGETFFYHTDGLGSVVAITDTDGNLVQRYGYDAWGNILLSEGPFTFTGSGSYVNSRAYIGREFDSESGLYHMRARAYDPSLGRFLQKDPEQGSLKNPQSQHLYAYALNNPVNFMDPTGRVALIQYAFILTYPNGREVAAALAGFLHGFGTTNIQFIAEYLNLISGIPPSDVGAIWDQAVANTARAMEETKSALGIAGNAADYAGVASIPSAFSGGVTFEIGVEISVITGDSDKVSFKAEGGGFVRGVDAGLSYLRSLRPR
ncbi:MAG: hypothetical protein GY703_05390 [Gammaproteobacteria bacterium]|nr:hypothetical protein [Gammaproteobacteria bacterium]